MSLFDLVSWDDGHRPGKTTAGTQMAINKDKQSSSFLSVFDNLMSEVWLDRIYEYSMNRNRKPWGVYVLTQTEVLNTAEIDVELLWNQGEHERAIGIYTTRQLIIQRAGGFLKNDLEKIHGTVVWCLASAVTNSVEYHIDYAELYRYETNIIHPPLYAGTCHISPLEEGEMEGGNFAANMDGLDHYKRFGYKGKLVTTTTNSNSDDNNTKGDMVVLPMPPADTNNHGSDKVLTTVLHDDLKGNIKATTPITTTITMTTSLQEDLQNSNSWQYVKYKRNRGIVHDGDLPHLSTPVSSITPGKYRVILGFNCFGPEVGECCIRAPEHSNAFNRTIKLYQAMATVTNTGEEGEDGEGDRESKEGEGVYGKDKHVTRPSITGAMGTTKKKGKGISAADIKKNPMLAKLLIAAAKRKKALDAENEKKVQAETEVDKGTVLEQRTEKKEKKEEVIA